MARKRQIWVVEEANRGKDNWEPVGLRHSKAEAQGHKKSLIARAADYFSEQRLVYRVVKYVPEPKKDAVSTRKPK